MRSASQANGAHAVQRDVGASGSMGGFWGAFPRGGQCGWVLWLFPLHKQTPWWRPSVGTPLQAQPPQNSPFRGGSGALGFLGCRLSQRGLPAPTFLWQPRRSLRAPLGKKKPLVLCWGGGHKEGGEPVPALFPLLPLPCESPAPPAAFSPAGPRRGRTRGLGVRSCGLGGAGGARPVLPAPARSPAGRAGGTSSAETRQPDPKCF